MANSEKKVPVGHPPAAVGVARSIPAYTVPVPTTVSMVLQHAIGMAPPSEPPADFPATNEGWNAFGNPEPAARRAALDNDLAAERLTVSEQQIAGVRCYVIEPVESSSEQESRVLLSVHGGGYVVGAGEAGIDEAMILARTMRAKTIAIDYRMPPSHPYPAAVDDLLAVWRDVLSEGGVLQTAWFGASAGAAIILCAVQRAIAEKIPVPSAIIAGTPWSDLSETGDSYHTNRHLDPMTYDGFLGKLARLYAGERDLKDPLVSPVYGSFAHFPPTLLLSGTRDLFLSNTIRVDRHLRDTGRESHLIVYEGQSHAAYLIPQFPEAAIAAQDMTRFLRKVWKEEEE